jgi:hypothetical protein
VASPSLGYGEYFEFVYAYGSSMHQKCSNHTLTNLLFSLWRFVGIIDPLVIHPNPHPGVSTCPSNPKVLQTKEHTSTAFSIVSTFESFKDYGGASSSMVDFQ